MSERPVDRLDLERELGALAEAIDWPATPDVAATIGLRLAEPAGPQPRRWLPSGRLGRPLVLALLLLALAVAIAAALAFGFPGLRITFTSDPLPPPNVPAASASASPSSSSASSASASVGAPGAGLALGRPVTLEVAGERLGQAVRIPTIAAREGPDAAYLEVVRGSPIVTLVWRAGPDLPPLREGSDVGLLVSQFRASLDEGLLEKLLRAGDTTIERIEVAGHPAFWITGAEHILWFRRADGDVLETFARLVGDTLALEVDGTIVRIETSGGRDGAIRIAESLP